MLRQLLQTVVEAVFGFFTMTLLARFLMQWTRAPFRNPLGKFVIAITDGVVRPMRRLIPNPFRFDLSTLLLAWLTQALLLGISLLLSGSDASPGAIGVVAVLAVFEVLKLSIYLIIAAVVMAAILSWVNPYSPVAPLFDALTQPFLGPLRRHMPPIGGVDLSPLVVLLILQLLLTVVAWARGAAVPALVGL